MPWNNGSSDGGSGNRGSSPWGDLGGGSGRNNGGRSGGNGSWGGGPRGSGEPPPDLDEALRRLQDYLRGLLPFGARGRGRGGMGGGRGLLLIIAVFAVVWLGTGFYRVQPDEQGVVLRFGAYNRTTLPGLNYHLPWPIETVELPAVTRINRVEIGYRSTGDLRDQVNGETPMREVPQESLMLTGDENIVDINFAVFWRIRDAGAYLFNTRNPDNTVKSVSESVMREVIGRTPIQPALTDARARIEADVFQGVQTILDQYGTGVEVTQVQLQKVDPPAAVIDSFRDVQRATTDAERMRNEADAYRNDIVPRARGDAARIVAAADGARQAAVAQATGESQRFLSVLAAYRAAKDITLQRLYIETMQDILRNTPSIIVDDKLQGIVPYLPLGDVNRPAAPAPKPAPPASSPPPAQTSLLMQPTVQAQP